MHITIINGPNLNRLGQRDTNLYGSTTVEELNTSLSIGFPETELRFFQSNHEGEIIDRIQTEATDPECSGIVMNPGAYAHYSYAIADAMRDASPFIPIIEVHISNILSREEFRRHSVTAEAANAGVISGCGVNGYALAISHLLTLPR